MERNERRKHSVFFAADFTLMLTALTFVQYNLTRGNILLGSLQLAGGVLFIAIGLLVLIKKKYLRLASWILVVSTSGFMLTMMFLTTLHITNLVWIAIPYFLSMFLLGLKGGTVVSIVYLVGTLVGMLTRLVLQDPSIEPVHEMNIIFANAFAFAFAANYEKVRTDNERELLLKNREIEIMSHQDGLTGLFNRRFFDRALHQEFHRAKREQQPLSLILLDIDFFKNFNDELGHVLGDACLGDVAKVIRAAITRSTDTATRYGGDEFALLLPNTDLKGASVIAQRIRSGMEERAIAHPLSSVAGIVTVSAGVALFSQEEDREPADLIRRADRALYASKAEGRDRVTCA